MSEAFADPVENFSPPLHGDALVDRQHGEADVVKVRDAVIGSLPAGPTLGPVDGAAASVASLSAGCRQLTFRRGVDICAPDRDEAADLRALYWRLQCRRFDDTSVRIGLCPSGVLVPV